MNIQTIITNHFHVEAGTPIVQYKDDCFGPQFMDCSTASKTGPAEGRQLLKAISVGAAHIARVQKAVDAMQACLDAGPVPPPIEDGKAA